MAWTSPRTWLAGEVLTAALLNTHLRDNLNAIGTWASYTVSWTASTTNPVLGNGTLSGKYIQAGKLVIVEILLTAGSTTTFGSGLMSLSLPAAPRVSQRQAFTGTFRDVSASDTYPLFGVLTSGTVDLLTTPTTAGNPLRSFGSSTPVTLATGDMIAISGTYEAA